MENRKEIRLIELKVVNAFVSCELQRTVVII
jgi:hypothetical protein